MRQPALHAVRPALALVAALAAVAGTPLAAQTDPFALPKGLNAQTARADDGPQLSEIVVDGRQKARMVTIEGSGRDVAIDAADARAAGLPVPQGATGAVKLASLRLYEWKFDALRQRLTVALFNENAGDNIKDLAGGSRMQPNAGRPLLALRVDYDLTASVSSRSTSAGGLVSGTLVYGNFGVNSTARIATDPLPGSPAVLRLDTTARMAIPSKGMAISAGDFVSAGSRSQRAVRMGGIQVSSDFSLRPDLVTIPLPGFAGTVAVPTTIDILNGDQRYQIGEVAPGDFTVRNVPLQAGRGEASVILRDVLGREVVQTSRFYVTDMLLAPHTTGYAVNAGFVRRRYGFASNDYGQLAATAFVRRGLSSHLTLEASGEWTAGVANGGVRGDFVIAKVALATVEARVSRDSTAGTGSLVQLAIESVGRKLGGSIRATLPSRNYRDVATRLGDDAPPREIVAQVFWRLAADADFQVSYARQDFRSVLPTGLRDRSSEVLNMNFQRRLSQRANLFAGGGVRRGGSGTVYSFAAGLSLSLGPRTNAGAYANYNDGRISAAATFAKSAQQDGELGYRGAANWSETSQRLAGGVTWRGRQLQLDGEVEEVDGVFAARANARGSLILAGGGFYARNQSGGSYVLVRTGKVGGIPITRENREVGVTNARGRLLVQDIPAQATIKIDVKADKLPADALVHETTKFIRVPQRAIAVVDIEALRFVPVVRQLVNSSGAPLAAGLAVRSLPSDTVSIVGYDGLAEINAGAGDERLLVGPAGFQCVVELDSRTLAGAEGPPLVCDPSPVIVQATVESRQGDRASPAARSQKRKKTRVALKD